MAEVGSGVRKAVRDSEDGTLVLDKIPVHVQTLVQRRALEEFPNLETQVRVIEDFMGDMLIELRAYVLAEKVGEQQVTVTFRHSFVRAFPSSPYQFWKERHAPEWYRRRWPVRYVTDEQYIEEKKVVTMDHFETFPEATIRTPEKFRGGLVVPYDRLRA